MNPPLVESGRSHRDGVDRRDAGVRADCDAGGAGERGQRHTELRRVDLAVGLEEAGADDPVGGHQREAVTRLVRGDLVERQAVGLGPADLAADLLEPFGGGGELDAPALHPGGCVLGLLQTSIEVDGVHVHPGERGIRPELTDESGGVERRPAGQLAALEQDDVGLTQLGQVVRDAGPTDTTTDDDDTGLGGYVDAGRVAHSLQARQRRGSGLDLSGGEDAG